MECFNPNSKPDDTITAVLLGRELVNDMIWNDRYLGLPSTLSPLLSNKHVVEPGRSAEPAHPSTKDKGTEEIVTCRAAAWPLYQIRPVGAESYGTARSAGDKLLRNDACDDVGRGVGAFPQPTNHCYTYHLMLSTEDPSFVLYKDILSFDCIHNICTVPRVYSTKDDLHSKFP